MTGVTQISSPSNVLFTGIGVLLRVNILLDPKCVRDLLKLQSLRPSKMSALAKMLLWTCLIDWNTFLSGLEQRSNRPQI